LANGFLPSTAAFLPVQLVAVVPLAIASLLPSLGVAAAI
jgi:hypothetical protein